jgi:hypothetical protein
MTHMVKWDAVEEVFCEACVAALRVNGHPEDITCPECPYRQDCGMKRLRDALKQRRVEQCSRCAGAGRVRDKAGDGRQDLEGNTVDEAWDQCPACGGSRWRKADQ